MRNKGRIKPFLRRVDLGFLIAQLWSKELGSPEDALNYQKDLEAHVYSDSFLNFWENNYDLRFTQLLCNNNYILFEPLYNKEEKDLLMMCGYTETESTLWGSNYGDDGLQLKETKYSFIDELDDLHLRKMISEANNKDRLYSPDMLKLFEKELHDRGFTNIKVNPNAMRYMQEGILTLKKRNLFDMIRIISETR